MNPPDSVELWSLYYEECYSLARIAGLYRVSTDMVRRWMDLYNMPRRNPVEALRIYYDSLNRCPICENPISPWQIHICWE